MPRPSYHIFLSYRREDGQHLARMLKESLVRKGYRVFLDLDELQDGIFDECILEALDEAPIYMLLMTKQCFTSCNDENDWIRREVERAIAKGKVIIPINPDRQFEDYPDDIPEHIKQALKVHQYSALDSGALYHESVDKLVRERVKPVIGVKHKALIWAIALFFITLVPYLLAYYCFLPSYYIHKGDKILAQDSATITDTLDAIKYYQYAIKAKNVEGYGRIGDIYDATSILASEWINHEDSALYYYKKGAYAGDNYSRCQMAYKLSSSLSVDYSPDSAFYWANEAYKEKYYKAPATLAYFYRNGKQVPENKFQAERLYKEGILLGDSSAHFALGTLYKYKFGYARYGDAVEHFIKAYKYGDWLVRFYLGKDSHWVLHPLADSVSEPLVKIKAIGWDTHDTMRLYCEWHNKKYQWMQIDTSAYVEDIYSGKRYQVSRVRNCKFSPDTTHVSMGHKHEFHLIFANVPDTLTRINFCESDTSQWKFFGIDLSNKIHIEPFVLDTTALNKN